MEQTIKNRLTCVIDFAHQLIIQNLGKLDFDCRTNSVNNDIAVNISLLSALETEEGGNYCIDVYSFDSWETIQKKMEYMKDLVTKYGGIGDVFADGEEDCNTEN